MGRDSNSEECGPGVQEKNEGVVVLTPRCTKIRMEFRPDNGFGLTYHPQGPLLLTGSSPPGGVDFLAILEAPASPDGVLQMFHRMPNVIQKPPLTPVTEEIPYDLGGLPARAVTFTRPTLAPRTVCDLYVLLRPIGDQVLLLFRSSERFDSAEAYRGCGMLSSIKFTLR
jgi:hypothetical protein